jgi:hypothetical protein
MKAGESRLSRLQRTRPLALIWFRYGDIFPASLPLPSADSAKSGAMGYPVKPVPARRIAGERPETGRMPSGFRTCSSELRQIILR